MNRTLAIGSGVAALLAFVSSASTVGSSESLGLTHELTAVDVAAWLDGYLPDALAQSSSVDDSMFFGEYRMPAPLSK